MSTASTEANRALANRIWEEIWHQGNLSLIDELFAADFVRHDPNGQELRGREQTRQFISGLRAAFPDLHYDIDDQIAEGDKVVTRYRFRGTHEGMFQGNLPTGKQVSYTGILIQRFDGGKMVEQWTEADLLSFLQQLGVIPVPGRAE
jgi:steroid delta-isomerase-like uncharacterized protein